MIYLDYNATAPMRAEVQAVMRELLGRPLNASSVHAGGREAKKILEESRKVIAEAVNCFANEVVFVGSGSEANNWALAGGNVLVSAVEHASVLKLAARHPHPNPLPSRERGYGADSSPSPLMGEGGGEGEAAIAVDSDGLVDLAALDARLRRGDIKLVSIILANNETGVIQPIREIAEIVHRHGALMHTDAVQGLGKIPLDFSALGVDMMTISAHKMGGPVGAAALIVQNRLALAPFIKGGGQELNRRAGTENIPAIAGFAEAVRRIDLAHMAKLRGWLDVMEAENLSAAPSGGGTIFGKSAPRLPNTSCIAMPGVPSETQMIAFDLEKIAVSAGSACSSGRIEASHVLKAMNVAENLASSAIRVSGGWDTSETAIKAFETGWKKLYQRLAKNAV